MISQFHLRAWQRVESVEVVALCDQSIERAEERRVRFAPRARVYTELGELLEKESLDFIDVLTPPASHKSICREVLAAGLHVVCQKPTADSLADAREITAAFSRTDRLLAIHENHRYRPWFREILQHDRDGFFGAKRYARFEQFDSQAPAEAYKLQAERGILLEYGTHVIDMIHALLGRPRSVTGAACRLHADVQGESLVHLTFALNGTTACVDLAWKSFGLPQGRVVVVGDRGEAIYEGTMTRGPRSRLRLVREDEVVVDEWRSPDEDYAESFVQFQSEFAAALLGHGPLPQSAVSNLDVLETTFGAYEAIETGRVIQFESG